MLEFFWFDVQLVMVRDQKVIMSIMKEDSSRSSGRILSLKGFVIGFEHRVRKLKEMVQGYPSNVNLCWIFLLALLPEKM